MSAFGIDKASLLSAGLTEEAVNLLYRALYVYPIGFQDKAKKLVGPLEHKHVPLNNIWRAYLAIAETAMKVGFKVKQRDHRLLGSLLRSELGSAMAIQQYSIIIKSTVSVQAVQHIVAGPPSTQPPQ